jgi:molybdopterin molybdotransferase
MSLHVPLNPFMIPAAEAEAKILALTPLPDGHHSLEQIDLTAAPQRILAQAVTSALNFPHWDNSAMDGYAVRYGDVKQASADHPITLTLTETIPAGKPPSQPVYPGQAARILTGSMVPNGADTIVIQEVTQRQGNQVRILAAPSPGQFVRAKASFYQAGTPLLPAGTPLGGPEIAVLAAAQCTSLAVYRQPRVAILSTGDELVSPSTPLQPGQIVDSNQHALAALIEQAGAIPVPLGIVPDQPQALTEGIQIALAQADMVVSSGGVSVGDYDYVDQVLVDLGATLHIRSVAVKPGKPLTVATFPPAAAAGSAGQRLYFGLPGNPVSALVSFWRFVAPALRKRSGLSGGWSPPFLTAVTQDGLKAGGGRETYLWGHLALTPQGNSFRLAGGSHSSGNLINLAGTNALAVLPVGTKAIEPGAPVTVMPLK